MYFLLVGMPPFRTGKPAEDKYLKVVARHLRNPPPDALVANPACDRELAELTRAMMAKRPAERPSYDELIAQLSRIVGRLDPAAVPLLIAARDRSRPIPLPPVERRSDEAPVAAGPIGEPAMPRAGLPGWLVALTFVCIALFVTGLVVYLRSGRGAASSAAPAHRPDRASTPAGSGSAPAAPGDTVVVRRSDGTAWFVVDARPVTDAAFRQVFAEHQQPEAPGGAVVMVSYVDARAYADTRHSKLLTPDEWDAALRTPGVQPAGDLLEWVESPDAGDEKTKLVRQIAASQPRPDQAQRDVTFRVKKPLPDH
jgi:hypothetical protein